ncbi:DUF4037 domain-containing protein [Faecalicatena contorta]|uniref:DUF4037 domain-containing protein n=1 Tax=Faecalicatena contorta TaxID=39482 RepID=UPI001F46EBF6|nr:DUF4037 domain-containing protein [Faecalicatena contorta]MCF2682807.1 DUF4037 domain-containing protein [Faecalicatena contorta]
MFDLNEFLMNLDEMYATNPKDVETFLKSGLAEADKCMDGAAMLTILNELMGYYRVMSQPEDCEWCIEKARRIADQLGIQGTVNYGTMLLNIGTAQRVMGQMEKAEASYQEAYDIFQEWLHDPDYRMATLYNNRSILYAKTGRLREAKQDLKAAMQLIQRLEQSDVEIAITHTNIGNLCFALQETDEGLAHMQEATEIFERQEGKKDPHYASALSGLGEAYFRKGELDHSINVYEKALQEILDNYGENDYYHVTARNLELVRDTKNRVEAIKNKNLKGMDISRKYYEAYGKPMLEKQFPKYVNRVAAGLVGEGSECLGYDDLTSTDHDYGPGFCLWLTREDYEAVGQAMQQAYAKLPKEFMGCPARNTTAQGNGRTGVICIDDFYARYTGYPEAPDQNSRAGLNEWMSIPIPALKTVTNGEIFTDPLGEFTRRREDFSNYPEGVRQRKLAMALGVMAQAGQYNYGRMCKRSDQAAAWLCISEFVNAAIETGYHLNQMYQPFYKWKMRGMDEFHVLTGMKKHLTELMEMTGETTEKVQSKIEEICVEVVRELNRQRLTDNKEAFLEIQKQDILRRLQRDGR